MVVLFASNILEHKVMQNAAALAYYLLFALFPMMIFISNLIGLLDLNVSSIIEGVMPILPNAIVALLETYLEHVSNTSSSVLMWFALVFTIWFPMRATRGLMDDVRRAYQLNKPARPASYIVRQLVFTIILLVVIVLTLLLSTVGRRLLVYLAERIPALDNIPDFLITLWQYLRFILLAVIMFATLGALYAMAQDHKQPVSVILPGAVVALVVWLAVSAGFSVYVDRFSNYSVLYGTLGAVIVLLTWLYMTSVILILGAELNAAIRTVRSEKKQERLT